MKTACDNPMFGGHHIILCKQHVGNCAGYKLHDSISRGSAGVASVRTGEGLPFAGHNWFLLAPQQTRSSLVLTIAVLSVITEYLLAFEVWGFFLCLYL